MADTTSLNFDDLTPYEEEFTLLGKRYALVEATGEAAVRYQNALFKATRTENGKMLPGDKLADTEPLLVSLCLFEVTDKGRVRVPEAAVRQLPNRAQKRLFAKILEVSDIRPKDEPKTLEEKADRLRVELREAEEAAVAGQAAKNGRSASPAG